MVDTKKPSPRHARELSGTETSAGTDDAHTSPATVRMTPPSERWESDHDLSRTLKMGTPSSPPAPAGSFGSPSPPSVPRPSRTPRVSEPPIRAESIELVVIDERQVPGAERRPWRAAEVWTKRRVYGLDSTFRCIEILDRETGRPELGHEMLGARLGGGRMRDKETVRFSYPLPIPGMEAMFSKGKKHGYTSAVERMVVRVRVLHTSADETAPTWDDIASRWSELPPKP